MAKEPTTPKEATTTKDKATKPVKAGIAKRTPVKTPPAKRSPTKSVVLNEDLVFLWKIMKMSTGMKIDWPAVAKDAGKAVGTVQKQWSRLNIKIQQNLPKTAPSESPNKDVNSSD